jgi:hypothetical protein
MTDFLQRFINRPHETREIQSGAFRLDESKPRHAIQSKAGGKKLSSNRHHDATHYDHKYFDTGSAYIFSGNLIDSRQAGWLELMLIQYAYSPLELGVNDNRSSPRSKYGHAHRFAIQLGRAWLCLLSSCTRHHFNTKALLCSA